MLDNMTSFKYRSELKTYRNNIKKLDKELKEEFPLPRTLRRLARWNRILDQILINKQLIEITQEELLVLSRG